MKYGFSAITIGLFISSCASLPTKTSDIPASHGAGICSGNLSTTSFWKLDNQGEIKRLWVYEILQTPSRQRRVTSIFVSDSDWNLQSATFHFENSKISVIAHRSHLEIESQINGNLTRKSIVSKGFNVAAPMLSFYLGAHRNLDMTKSVGIVDLNSTGISVKTAMFKKNTSGVHESFFAEIRDQRVAIQLNADDSLMSMTVIEPASTVICTSSQEEDQLTQLDPKERDAIRLFFNSL